MKQIEKGDYLSPQTALYSFCCEGVLCTSIEKLYESVTNEGYTSTDDLYEIF